MSYSDQANLATDSEFKRRLGMALASESTPKADDPLADMILRGVSYGVDIFMPFISTSPGFGDAYASSGQEGITDGDILSAVQANWQAVTALYGGPVPE